MSLDITSHPGTPGPDELVPSRYALREDMQIYCRTIDHSVKMTSRI